MTGWKRATDIPVAARRVAMALALCLWLGACGSAAPSQSGFRIAVDLRCTTCNDFMRCTAENADAAYPQIPLTVYRLREKSFWSQVATIGDYLFQWVRSKSSDRRPFVAYKRVEGVWSTSSAGEAIIDTAVARIVLGGASIDQRSGAWITPGAAGLCAVMPRKEGFALVRQLLGRPLPPAAESAAKAPPR